MHTHSPRTHVRPTPLPRAARMIHRSSILQTQKLNREASRFSLTPRAPLVTSIAHRAHEKKVTILMTELSGGQEEETN
jgi:hypothetical protein